MYIVHDSWFEWDDDKAAANEQLHDGVSFHEARAVFADPARVELYDEAHSEDEGRWAVIGFSRKGRLLFVVFTTRGERIRLISARFAESDEEEIYEQES